MAKLLTLESMQWVWYDDHNRYSDKTNMRFYIFRNCGKIESSYVGVGVLSTARVILESFLLSISFICWS